MLRITTTSVPDGAVGQIYQTVLYAAGGIPPYYWGIATGTSLPPGLSIDPDGGIIYGMPTTPGDYSFTVFVSDMDFDIAYRDFDMKVEADLPPDKLSDLAVSSYWISA